MFGKVVKVIDDVVGTGLVYHRGIVFGVHLGIDPILRTGSS